MFHCEAESIKTHDLLEINAKLFLSNCALRPTWVDDNLSDNPFVVVRRGLKTSQNIPVGARGSARNQRWATVCDPKFVKRVITPSQLLRGTIPAFRLDAVPALRSLHLEQRWADFHLAWGPGGSVGFELATGNHVVSSESDLDIVIDAGKSMTVSEAKALCDSTMDLPAAVDIRVETPICGFSLREYALQSPAPILLRTPCGVTLGSAPWDDIEVMDAMHTA